MKVTNTKTRPDGRRILTVEVDKDEDLISVNTDSFYQLGGSDGDIVPGHLLNDLNCVSWCWIQQKWV